MDEIIQETLSKGVELHLAGKFDLASQLYASVIKLQPEHADANHNMGLLKIDTGNATEALPYLQTALQVDTSITQFWLSYANALIALERLDEASRILSLAKENGIDSEELLKLDQQVSKHQNEANLATAPIYYQGSSRLNSEGAFQGSLDENIGALVNLYNSGQLSKVIEMAQSVIDRNPDAFIAWNILGIAYSGQGMLQEAVKAYQKAVYLKPDYPEAPQ